MRARYIFAAALIFVLSTGCKKETKGNPGPNEVWLEYKAFNPTQLTVAAGTTVTFTNKDNADHSVTSNNSLFDSGKISSGNSYTYTFATAGTYYFFCHYHSSNSSEQGAVVAQ